MKKGVIFHYFMLMESMLSISYITIFDNTSY